MEKDPHLEVEPVSIINNDDIIEATPTSSIALNNDMDIYDYGIEVPISLSNSLFAEEEQQYQPNSNYLEEGKNMSHICCYARQRHHDVINIQYTILCNVVKVYVDNIFPSTISTYYGTIVLIHTDGQTTNNTR